MSIDHGGYEYCKLFLRTDTPRQHLPGGTAVRPTVVLPVSADRGPALHERIRTSGEYTPAEFMEVLAQLAPGDSWSPTRPTP